MDFHAESSVYHFSEKTEASSVCQNFGHLPRTSRSQKSLGNMTRHLSGHFPSRTNGISRKQAKICSPNIVSLALIFPSLRLQGQVCNNPRDDGWWQRGLCFHGNCISPALIEHGEQHTISGQPHSKVNILGFTYCTAAHTDQLSSAAWRFFELQRRPKPHLFFQLIGLHCKWLRPEKFVVDLFFFF